MGVMIDLTDKKFGRLTVIERDTQTKNRNIKWICKCDCGNIKSIVGHKLRSGNTKSCTCLRNTLRGDEVRLGSGYANMRELYRTYKKSALTRNYDFNIDMETFHKLTSDNCYYCGSKPKQIKQHKQCFGEYLYNGIDRVDNSKGYIDGNIITCCKSCNYAKNTLDIKQFITLIEKLHNNLENIKILDI